MDDVEETEVVSVGERLRMAREEKGLTLEEVASQTRIPRRHLESLESGDWERLPAPTYSIGFAKSYAGAVGLDRAEIGEQLRAEMGGPRPATTTAEPFEPVDPARTMPRWLVVGAIAAVVFVVILFSWLNERTLAPTADPAAEPAAVAETEPQPAPAAAAPAPAAEGPVVITASGPAWIQVTDQGRKLFEGMLSPGQSYEVPQTAAAPLLRAGAPESIRITVGDQVAPPVGPPGRVASNVSLRGSDLLGRGDDTPATPAPSAPPLVQNSAG
jgi:cytoskeleton protein RodZ